MPQLLRVSRSRESISYLMVIPSFLVALIFFYIWGRCGSKAGIVTPVAVDSVIVVVPGYSGPRLVDAATEDGVWISRWQALVGDKSLALPRKDLGFLNGLDLNQDGIL